MAVTNWSTVKAQFRPMLPLACFVVFALGLLALHQEKMGRFTVDEEWPIPTALSHVLFASPLGIADKALLDYFRRPRDQSTTKEMVEQVVRNGIAPTHVEQMVLDGEGIGPPLSATLAFELFGPHARSLSLLFLTLLGLSAASYILRFRGERLWVAPVLLAALTLLLLTRATELPLVAAEAPIGGQRSYILLAILPTLHWCFELVGEKSQSRREAWFRGVLLGIQVVILGAAIFVRYSPVCLIGAVIVSALVGLRASSAKRVAVVFFVPFTIMLIALYGVVPLSFSKEAKSGRLQTLVWHRAFVGLGINPEWPFPGISQEYQCPQLPGALRPQSDSNGACVWFAAPMNRFRPAEEVWAGLYGPEYEAVLRQAFFHVAFEYPGKTLATFLYYKPATMIEQTIAALIPWAAIPARVGALAVLQLVLLVGFLATEPAAGRGVKIGTGLTIAAAVVLSAFIPHLFAWTTLATGQELSVGVLCGAMIGIWLGCRAMLRRLGLQGRKPTAAVRCES